MNVFPLQVVVACAYVRALISYIFAILLFTTARVPLIVARTGKPLYDLRDGKNREFVSEK